MLAPSLISAPASTPVSLSEAKAHLRLDFDDEDTIVGAYLAAAIAHLDGPDGVLARALVSQTWRQDFKAWPDDCGKLRLPLAPVSAIGSVKYSDAQNVEQTVTASGNYTLGHDERGAYVRFTSTFAFPSLYEERDDRVRVEFTAGYGSASDVPAALKSAILLMVADLYAARESFSNTGASAAVSTSVPVNFLLQPYRRVWG